MEYIFFLCDFLNYTIFLNNLLCYIVLRIEI